MNPWFAMLVFVGMFAGMFGVMRLVQQRVSLAPELSRKIVHVLMGLATLSFPWLFAESWPVVVLAAVTVGAMALIRLVPAVRAAFGAVIGGVARFSLGEFYYPAAVAIVFVLSGGDPVLYCVPMLILTLADPCAALIGARYGTLRFTTLKDRKSVEGSVAFFSIAFLSTHVPLLLATDTGRAECLLIAVTMAFVVMLLEAISWRGLDNLLIPLGAHIMLRTYLDQEVPELAALAAVTAALFVFAMVWRRRTTLKDGALLGAVLLGYLCFSWGGWQWLVAPLVLLCTYTLLWPPAHETHPRRHDLRAVISVTGPGLIWLIAAKTLDEPRLLYAYTLAFAAQLAIIGIARVKRARPEITAPMLLTIATLKGWLVLMVPFVIVEAVDRPAVELALLAPIGIVVASVLFYATQPELERFPTGLGRWLRQGLCAIAGSALALIPLYVVDRWNY